VRRPHPVPRRDGIKDYPTCAFSDHRWKQTVYNGGIYGVPIHARIAGHLVINQTRFDADWRRPPKDGADSNAPPHSANPTPASGASAAMHNTPSVDRYSVGAPVGDVPRAHNWRVDANGKFVKDIETDEFKSASNTRAICGRPDCSLPTPWTTTSSNNKTNLVAGRFACSGWLVLSYPAEYWDKGIKLNPPVNSATLHPFSHGRRSTNLHPVSGVQRHDGSEEGQHGPHQGTAAHPEFLAAPFGSEEAFPAGVRCQGCRLHSIRRAIRC